MRLTIIEFFQIPEEFSLLELASRIKRILQFRLDIANLTQFEILQHNEMIAYLSQITAANVPARTRAELHNHLKAAAFVATLLLLEEPTDDLYAESIVNQQFALLTHLHNARFLHDYTAYLQFYKAFIEKGEPVFPLHQLLHLTTLEVHQQLVHASTKRGYLTSVTPFFLRAQRASSADKHSLMKAKNAHVQTIDDGLEYVETSDEEGEKAFTGLSLASDIPLTHEQQRRKFRFKIAGAQRAFYTYENGAAFSMHAALPVEINEFLQTCAPNLLSNSHAQINAEEVAYWLIFMLKLFGVSAPFKLILNNCGGKVQFDVQSNQIAYKFERQDLFITATLELGADLLTTLSPETVDQRLHFVASTRLTMPLPFIVLELLNFTLRKIGSAPRHGVTLEYALRFDEQAYNRWLNAKLKTTSLPLRGIGVAALHRSFFQFSKNSVPETYRAFLTQKSTVQSHYISASQHDVSATILRAWRDFSDACSMRWWHADAHETSKSEVAPVFNREVGSKITLRNELLDALYQLLLSHVDLNNIAFYIYLRIASTSALRPVQTPFPQNSHIDLGAGCMTVADKRAHSDDERRFVVLTSFACKLLAQWRKAAESHAIKHGIDRPTHGLMWLDEHMKWQHFDAKTVNTRLYEHTNQLLKSHSLRHVAAKNFLQFSEHFDQRLLNFLMNHSRAGVGLLDRFSALSPCTAANLLRSELEISDAQFASLDAQALAHSDLLA